MSNGNLYAIAAGLIMLFASNCGLGYLVRRAGRELKLRRKKLRKASAEIAQAHMTIALVAHGPISDDEKIAACRQFVHQRGIEVEFQRVDKP